MKKIALAFITLSMLLVACAKTSSHREMSIEEMEKSQKIMDGKARADSASQIRIVPNPNPQKSFNKPKRIGNG